MGVGLRQYVRFCSSLSIVPYSARLTNRIAVLFQFTVPLMLKVWAVKTAFLFVGLGVP